MTRLNVEIQRTNAEATIIGRDRVHPGDLGHFLMAYWFLTAQGMQSTVADTEIDVQAKKASAKNCVISDLTIGTDVSFTYRASSLPFPVAGAYLASDMLLPITRTLNVERLAVRGLASGEYTVTAENAVIGVYSAQVLADGVNIATNMAWAAQQQALSVHALNWNRLNTERNLRTIAQVEHGMRRSGVDTSNDEAVQKYTDDLLSRTASSGNAAYYRSVVSNYYLMRPRADEFTARTDELMDQCMLSNQPVARKFVIRKM